MSDIEDLFAEPEGFRPPPPEHHFADHTRVVDAEPKTVKLRLVGTSPLWGHLLWNAGIFTANYIDQHPELCRGKRVLELGAASALPGLICGLNGAAKVVSTDYPDAELILNIQYNVDHCKGLKEGQVEVRGFIWGGDKSAIYGEDYGEITEDDKFDLLILLDLVFNHTEHHKLLQDCRDLLKKTGKALVVFSPHRPWLLDNDLDFFTKALDYDLKPEKIDLVTWKPMFEEDEETVDIRARVYSFFLLPQWS